MKISGAFPFILGTFPFIVTVIECKFMCSMHNEAKHTQMSEFGTEKGLLQGHGTGRVAQTPKYPRLPTGFQQNNLKAR